MTVKQKWSFEDLEYVKKAASENVPHQVIAETLNKRNPQQQRTTGAITQKLRDLRIKGDAKSKPMPRWTPEEEAKLKAAWETSTPYTKIWEMFPGRSKYSVYHKASSSAGKNQLNNTPIT